MKVYDELEQGSEEWLRVRLGKFTASKALDLFSKPSTDTYQNLINNKVYELHTNKIVPMKVTEWMERGTELEPQARMEFEFDKRNKGLVVKECGFIEQSEFIGMSKISPSNISLVLIPDEMIFLLVLIDCYRKIFFKKY